MIEEGGGEKAGVRVPGLMLLITMSDPIVVNELSDYGVVQCLKLDEWQKQK